MGNMELPYTYQPLMTVTNYRVMHLMPGNIQEDIRFSLSEHTEDDKVAYHAISYAWESTELPHTIYSADGFLKITKSLFKALQRYRLQDQPILLWVDAICISQSDLAERGQQVQLMSKIFSRSCQVMVWLGEEGATDKAMFDFIKTSVDTHWSRWDNAPDDPITVGDIARKMRGIIIGNDLVEGMTKFFERSWFSRAWTYQEIICASQARLSCGSLEIDYEDVFTFAVLCDHVGLEAFYNSSMAIQNLSHVVEAWLRRDDHRQRNTAAPFVSLVNSGRIRACTDPHDKIYSLLGMALQPNPLPYQPNYSIEVGKLYRDFALHAIHQFQNLNVLQMSNFNGGISSQPSWVPDWKLDHDPSIQEYPFRLYQASGDHPLRVFPSTRETDLIVEGFIIDKIIKLSSLDLNVGSGSNFNASVVRVMCENKYAIIQETLEMTSSSERYLDKNDRIEAWWRTLIGDRSNHKLQATPETGLDFQIFLQVLKRFATEKSVRRFTDEEGYKFAKVERMLVNMAGLRKFCVTEQGRFGWVCKSALPSDVVGILFGSTTPILLRPKDDSFLVVEPCYIHGVMYGEAMTKENLSQAQPVCLV